MSSLFRVDPYGPNAAEIALVRRRLTPQQALFVDTYLVDLDSDRAAAAANMRTKTGRPKQGKAVLKDYWINRAVQLVMAERRHRLGVSQERIVEEYAKIGFSNMGDYLRADERGNPYFDYANLDRDQTAAISEVTVEEYVDGRGEDAREVRRTKFKLHDKKAALDSLGRYLGLFVDRVEMKTQMEVKLLNMTRADRLALMQELLEGARRFLPARAIEDVEYKEMIGGSSE